MVIDCGVLLIGALDKVAYGLLIFGLSLDHFDGASLVGSCGSILGVIRGSILGHVDNALRKCSHIRSGVLLNGVIGGNLGFAILSDPEHSMGNSWWRNVKFLGQNCSVGAIRFTESKFRGILRYVGLNRCVFRRILASIRFQRGVRFFSLVSGRI